MLFDNLKYFFKTFVNQKYQITRGPFIRQNMLHWEGTPRP